MYLVRRDGHLHTPEAHQVPVTVVYAHGDAVLFCERHGPAHDVRVAGVEATRHVGAGDVPHQLFVGAEAIRAEAFAHVAVEIYLHLRSLWSRAVCRATEFLTPR